jgi:hypothetical protein
MDIYGTFIAKYPQISTTHRCIHRLLASYTPQLYENWPEDDMLKYVSFLKSFGFLKKRLYSLEELCKRRIIQYHYSDANMKIEDNIIYLNVQDAVDMVQECIYFKVGQR